MQFQATAEWDQPYHCLLSPSLQEQPGQNRTHGMAFLGSPHLQSVLYPFPGERFKSHFYGGWNPIFLNQWGVVFNLRPAVTPSDVLYGTPMHVDINQAWADLQAPFSASPWTPKVGSENSNLQENKFSNCCQEAWIKCRNQLIAELPESL